MPEALYSHHTFPLRDGQIPTTGRTGSKVHLWVCLLSLSALSLHLPALSPPPSSLLLLLSLGSSSLDLSHLHSLPGLEEKEKQWNRLSLPCWRVLNFISQDHGGEESVDHSPKGKPSPNTGLASVLRKQRLTPLRFWVVRTYCECLCARHAPHFPKHTSLSLLCNEPAHFLGESAHLLGRFIRTTLGIFPRQKAINSP